MRRLALVLVAFALAGCSDVVAGEPRAASTAVNLLPTEPQITAAVGNPLNTFGFRPFIGGPEIMPDGFRNDDDASPIRCIGVTETMARITYDGAEILEAARQSYFSLSPGVGVSGADAAVVRFGSESAARDRFETFVAEWTDCKGRSVVKRLRGTTGADVNAVIDGVIADGALLTATVTTRQGDGPESHYVRAVGVRDATVVEVALAVARAGDQSTVQAAAVARAMLDKA
jgi:hypothetical protein